MAFVFFEERRAIRFHDVFLFKMKGDRFDMFLSYLIRCPVLAQAEFALKNPGKVLRSVLGLG